MFLSPVMPSPNKSARDAESGSESDSGSDSSSDEDRPAKGKGRVNLKPPPSGTRHGRTRSTNDDEEGEEEAKPAANPDFLNLESFFSSSSSSSSTAASSSQPVHVDLPAVQTNVAPASYDPFAMLAQRKAEQLPTYTNKPQQGYGAPQQAPPQYQAQAAPQQVPKVPDDPFAMLARRS
jgi:hypothetical protein